MKTKKYLVFGLFLVLSSVLVSAGSFIIGSNTLVLDRDIIITPDNPLIIKDGKIVSSGNSEIELVPLSPTISTPSQQLSKDVSRGLVVRMGKNCGFFNMGGVSVTGNYYCENGDAIVDGELIVKAG